MKCQECKKRKATCIINNLDVCEKCFNKLKRRNPKELKKPDYINEKNWKEATRKLR